MAEPDEPEDVAPPPPTAAEDRATAAAMSNLQTGTNDDAEEEAQQRQKAKVDPASLSAAISRLEIQSAVGAGKEGKKKSEGEVRREEERRRREEEKVRRGKVKVAGGDVALLVEELDLSKGRATDLLKEFDGDVVKTMRAFVRVEG